MLKIKSFYTVFLLCTLQFVLQAQSLDSLISLAVEVSPKVKMLKAKHSAAENRIEQDSNLPDPTLTLGLANLPVNSFSFTQEPMTGKVIGLSQSIPFPGKLSGTGEMNKVDALIVQQEIADAINEVKKNLSQNYYELIFTRKAIELTKENEKLLNNIVEIVRSKYSVSTASQQNILKVELERTAIADKIEELKNKENSLTALINAMIIADPSNKIVTNELPKINNQIYSAAKLDSIASANRPYLIGVKLAQKKAQLQQNLANLNFYPNFNLSVQYSLRDKIARTNTPLNNFFTVMIGFTLPLNYGGKTSAKVEEAASMQSFYSEQYQMAMQSLRGNFGTSTVKINSLKERMKILLEGLQPQAEQNLTSAMSSYQVGQIDFINVIDAQAKLYEIETNLYRLKTDYLKEINELEFLIGSDLK